MSHTAETCELAGRNCSYGMPGGCAEQSVNGMQTKNSKSTSMEILTLKNGFR
ncbi:hypothetical protein CSKR_203677, partial [Clonorchis sinensis]